jgi:predicted DNA-binding ribbon-helix-helix protein
MTAPNTAPAGGGTRLRQRTFRLAGGGKKPVRLEEDYWDTLEFIAGKQGRSLAQLVAEVDAARQESALASALRVYAIDTLRFRRV